MAKLTKKPWRCPSSYGPCSTGCRCRSSSCSGCSFCFLSSMPYPDCIIQYCMDRMTKDSVTLEDKDKERRAFRSVDKDEVTRRDNVVIYSKPKTTGYNFESKLRSMNYDSHQLCFLMYILFRKGYVTSGRPSSHSPFGRGCT